MLGIGTTQLKWLNKQCLHITRKFDSAYNLWPKFYRWRIDQALIKSNVVKIIVQEGTARAVARVARGANTRATLPPVAGTTNVVTGWIGEENIGTLVATLCTTFEGPSSSSK